MKLSRVLAFVTIMSAGLAASSMLYLDWRWTRRADANLSSRVAQRFVGTAQTRVPCHDIRVLRPWVLLILGQSNAGNHGAQALSAHGPVNVITVDGQCHRTFDPLPGGTGDGGSIWSRLPAALAEKGVTRPVVFAVLAVDATSVHDWTASASPLPDLIGRLATQASKLDMPVDLVLWHQGEADARAGTTTGAYEAALLQLSDQLRAAGVKAQFVLAKSTICRSPPAPDVRTAVDHLQAHPQFAVGPDTDILSTAGDRTDGCHFSDRGLQSAAQLWAQALRPLLP